MPLRSIPPRISTGPGRRAPMPVRRTSYSVKIGYPSKKAKEPEPYKPSVYKKPREWQYVTKPFFTRIREPLIDVFKEAQEVQIIIDLGGFTRDEISFGLKNGKYTIYGKHGLQEFKEVIELPKEVDPDNIIESFKNNILDIVLPRKTKQVVRKKLAKIKKTKRKKAKNNTIMRYEVEC